MVLLFYYILTQKEYDSLKTKKENGLYLTSDTKRLYKGKDLYSSGISEEQVNAIINTQTVNLTATVTSLQTRLDTIERKLNEVEQSFEKFKTEDLNFENATVDSIEVENFKIGNEDLNILV